MRIPLQGFQTRSLMPDLLPIRPSPPPKSLASAASLSASIICARASHNLAQLVVFRIGYQGARHQRGWREPGRGKTSSIHLISKWFEWSRGIQSLVLHAQEEHKSARMGSVKAQKVAGMRLNKPARKMRSRRVRRLADAWFLSLACGWLYESVNQKM
ncbi:uncharacterized protein EDB91DRAFT_1148906 [Suillus paluster]|uniref:uncharacterized protein n=1 Tax=Suillus paluster TaxID=48578 RepID=UPI001B87BA97|nr:uncharacterized protein EDB91DRAFT_1148906 [Suillus paluster]KAG1733341.1 hypothetical protein EDB91DRAFT_1148906 [Suillus paluster]